MSLLLEIQNDAVSDKIPVLTLLRKLLVLASNLKSDVLEEWVRFEMNGYPAEAEVPKYRQIEMYFKVTGANMAYQITNAPVPSTAVKVVTGKKDINILKYRRSIGTINVEELRSAENLSVDMMNYAHMLSGSVIEKSYAIHAFWGEVPPHEVIAIVDIVRNRILDFTLTLKREYPEAGEVGALNTNDASMEKAVMQIFNTTVQGNAGVIGVAKNSTININVKNGDIQDLRQHLANFGVGIEDLDSLAVALKDEPNMTGDKTFGPEVGRWVGGMVTKAASGVWGVGVKAGGALLERALLNYYGFGS
ncbi:hypothetical protein A6U84_25920 (plasmid) [Agrobacterium sp. 13-2099-1-2]|uniref:AbiTii domain-containing protein n=1 Tax=Agrobacterium sp. 13-2099-1-2 TaxID=1841651 RepID=UPI00080FF4A0|nr:hypothetical protein [Agrobacterium sp. 13-2099-1-2]UZX45511.1 hypothetical protein A6U84_25920 [Agrobacterium sp. 13-2099-1-2]